jgi:hypothetical protein
MLRLALIAYCVCSELCEDPISCLFAASKFAAIPIVGHEATVITVEHLTGPGQTVATLNGIKRILHPEIRVLRLLFWDTERGRTNIGFRLQ